MEKSIGNYFIETDDNGVVRIDYKRSTKDFFYMIVYFVLATPILFFDYKLFTYLLKKELSLNIAIGYFFSLGLLLLGLYFLLVSMETLIKPTKGAFEIDKANKKLKVRLSQFRKREFPFDEINQFSLRAEKISLASYNRGRTSQRPLLLVYLYVELINGKTIKLHQFEGGDLITSNLQNKKDRSLKEMSKQIADRIAKECDKEIFWKQNRKD